MNQTLEQKHLCNLCGETCVLGTSDHPTYSPHGLVDATVDGGYSSTAGNGYGALDDMTRYKFSLCEFCLDWLFSQFSIPVAVSNYMLGDDFSSDSIEVDLGAEPWKPAVERIESDKWRTAKDEFFKQFVKRNAARNRK